MENEGSGSNDVQRLAGRCALQRQQRLPQVDAAIGAVQAAGLESIGTAAGQGWQGCEHGIHRCQL